MNEMRAAYLSTAFHGWSQMRPTYLGPSTAVTPEWCETEGVGSYGIDLDGHIMDFEATAAEIPKENVAAIKALLASGRDVFILSNTADTSSRRQRPYEVAEVLGIHPDRVFGTYTLGLAKPHTATLEYAIESGPSDKSRTIYGGDQAFKDVAVANRAGVRSLLSARLGPNDHIGVKLAQRPILEAGARVAWSLFHDINVPRIPILTAAFPQDEIITVTPSHLTLPKSQ